MNIIDLRERPEKISLLAEWHHNEWSYLNPQSGLKERLEKMQRYLYDKLIPSTYVAEETEEVIGSAAIIEHDMETRMEYSPWLASVFVSPKHRNKGVGSKLVSYIMSLAKQNSLNRLYLFTPDKELFYKRLGWCTIHKELFRGIEVSIMQVQFVG